MAKRSAKTVPSRIVPSITRHLTTGARSTRRRLPHGKRARGLQSNEQLPFAPPEDWYEPQETRRDNPYDFEVVKQTPGSGFRHILTPDDVRQRLSQLPEHFVAPVDIVQLSRMTRKKQSFSCYGMQWGSTLYLYPMEESLVEYHGAPPKPSQITEAEMYGGRWIQDDTYSWRLVWTEKAIRDFYLNNILIHELGHLLDDRNRSYVDRERYAEWFAVEYGYRLTDRLEPAARRGKPTVRHGKK